uniref:Uncharacterized protein n=1 Tax=viral metagenome TaxID=1070528 RepID=A0A6H1ZVT6_9ZZZZ
MLKELLKEKLEKVKPKKSELTAEVAQPNFPSLYLSSDTLSEIEDWEVGDEYYIVMKVEQKGKSMRTEEKKEIYNADFDIKEIGVLDEEEKKEDLKKKFLG